MTSSNDLRLKVVPLLKKSVTGPAFAAHPLGSQATLGHSSMADTQVPQDTSTHFVTEVRGVAKVNLLKHYQSSSMHHMIGLAEGSECIRVFGGRECQSGTTPPDPAPEYS